MKIKLLHDAKVRFSAGQELEVEGREAERLLSLGLVEVVPAKPAAKKTTTKKKEG